jgi:hypothetical protein
MEGEYFRIHDDGMRCARSGVEQWFVDILRTSVKNQSICCAKFRNIKWFAFLERLKVMSAKAKNLKAVEPLKLQPLERMRHYGT